MIASCSGSGYGRDNSVRLWDVGTGRELKKFQGHSAQNTGVSFSSDGTMLASCSG
jgi:WD40 repeat protein